MDVSPLIATAAFMICWITATRIAISAGARCGAIGGEYGIVVGDLVDHPRQILRVNGLPRRRRSRQLIQAFARRRVVLERIVEKAPVGLALQARHVPSTRPAMRKSIVELIGELHAKGLWTGITLRPPPDAATLADTGGSPGAQGFD
jgi:hypothetical protein